MQDQQTQYQKKTNEQQMHDYMVENNKCATSIARETPIANGFE